MPYNLHLQEPHRAIVTVVSRVDLKTLNNCLDTYRNKPGFEWVHATDSIKSKDFEGVRGFTIAKSVEYDVKVTKS